MLANLVEGFHFENPDIPPRRSQVTGSKITYRSGHNLFCSLHLPTEFEEVVARVWSQAYVTVEIIFVVGVIL